MRRESADEVAREARRRLDELGRHWAGSEAHDAPSPLLGNVEGGAVPSPGRHARQALEDHPGRGDRLLRRVFAGMAGFRRAHLGLIAALGLGAVVLASWAAMRPGPQSVPVTNTRPVAATKIFEQPVSTATAHPGADSSIAAVVVVDVAGKVRSPGVATLPRGSRVIDALQHAGGAAAGVDLSTLNLARLLVDGEQILVGQAAAVGTAPGSVAGAGAGAGAGASAGAAGVGTGTSAPVSLNSATAELLEGLPGVGPVTAQKILSWRTEHGPFTAIDELLEVPGIGPKTLAEIAPGLTL